MEDALRIIRDLARRQRRPVRIMEVCGTHTVAIFRHGLRQLLPEDIRLISGPGCPVCVTSIADIERAIEIAGRPEVILATFGDMMRVPGQSRSLTDARASGADVRIVYSPMDCLSLAKDNPSRRVVFFASGFETTSPSVAATIEMADKAGVDNMYVYSVHKVVPPALRILAENPDLSIDGFLLPGHVSTIIGRDAYRFLASDYGIPSVIAGFGAEDIVHSILMILKQRESGVADVEIQYRGAVRNEGNPVARAFLQKYFTSVDARWRGIGTIAKSGLALSEDHGARDILRVLKVEVPESAEPTGCRCGEVLVGKILPSQCGLFARACTPEKPVGACMVSTEGSCAAYYKYGAR